MQVPVFKVLLVGDPNVGKSSLIRRLILGEFDPNYQTTVGVDLSAAALNIDAFIPVILTIIDLGGQDDFSALRTQYYRGAHYVVFVYDITNRTSFEDLRRWYNRFLESVISTNSREVLMMTIGNKKDQADARQVRTDEGKTFAQSLGQPYAETSAKTGENVMETFLNIAKECYQQFPPPKHPTHS